MSKYLTQTFMSHGNEMICQPVTLSGYAEWPKVADAVIEAQKPLMLMHFHEMFLGKEHKIWSKPHNGKGSLVFLSTHGRVVPYT